MFPTRLFLSFFLGGSIFERSCSSSIFVCMNAIMLRHKWLNWEGDEPQYFTVVFQACMVYIAVAFSCLHFLRKTNAAGGLSFCIQRVHAFASFLHSCVHPHFLKYRDHFHRCVIWLHDLLASVGWLSTQSLSLTARFCDCMVCTGVVFWHPLADCPPKASSWLPVSVTAWCVLAWSSGIRWLIVHPKRCLVCLFLWLHGVIFVLKFPLCAFEWSSVVHWLIVLLKHLFALPFLWLHGDMFVCELPLCAWLPAGVDLASTWERRWWCWLHGDMFVCELPLCAWLPAGVDLASTWERR